MIADGSRSARLRRPTSDGECVALHGKRILLIVEASSWSMSAKILAIAFGGIRAVGRLDLRADRLFRVDGTVRRWFLVRGRDGSRLLPGCAGFPRSGCVLASTVGRFLNAFPAACLSGRVHRSRECWPVGLDQRLLPARDTVVHTVSRDGTRSLARVRWRGSACCGSVRPMPHERGRRRMCGTCE